MEKIVHAKLSKFLSSYLSDFQSGFKKHDGTTLQLTRIVHQWSEAVDQSAMSAPFSLTCVRLLTVCGTAVY